MTDPSVPLSFSAEQLLGALERRVLGEAPAAEWLAALVDHDRVLAQSAADGDVDEVLAAARSQEGAALGRAAIGERAAQWAGEAGREVAGTGDVAAAVVAALPSAPPAGREPPTGIEAEPGEKPDQPAPEEPEAEPDQPAPEEPVAEEPEEKAGAHNAPTWSSPASASSPTEPNVAGTRTFRVFVSSTFKDLEQERDYLRQHVYPELRALCAEHGARFQAIDLRWGVSREASLDQQAMNVCLGEVDRCREVTPRPNFLVLLGNRHGWLAPPPQIPAAELETILGQVRAEQDKALLTGPGGWYRRDDNAVPAEYQLCPREGVYEQDDVWAPIESRISAVLADAARRTAYRDDPKYWASATEREVLHGAIGAGALEGHAFCFLRELAGDHPDPAVAAPGDPILDFLDPDQAPLEAMRGTLRSELPCKEYSVSWDPRAGRVTTAHLPLLAADVRAALTASILEEIRHPSPPPTEAGTPPRIATHAALDGEGRAHRAFGDGRCRNFVGREDVLATIAAHLRADSAQPLVVVGGGGTGKSAVLAEAVCRAQLGRSEVDVVYRFIGATAASSDTRSLLRGLCDELTRRGGGGGALVPTAYQELVADFRARLERLGRDGPVMLFLDSLDQLTPSDGGRELAWLPNPLPSGVRMVVSTRPEDTLDSLRERAAPTAELGPMTRTDGAELLRWWLHDAHRALRPDQTDAVLERFEASAGNPLYLHLAFQEARRWTSHDPPETLATGVRGILAQNTFARLAQEENHGEVLVSRTLGYLAASRHGLAEDELLDLLSRDPDVYTWFLRGAHHIPPDLREQLSAHAPDERAVMEWVGRVRIGETTQPSLDELLTAGAGLRLPAVLWSRLMYDLRLYLADRLADGAVLVSFFHRELRDVARSQFLGERAVLYHTRLADYFESKGYGYTRTLSELIHHLADAGADERLADVMDGEFPERKLGRLGSMADVAHDYVEAMHACERRRDLPRAVSFSLRRSMMYPKANALADDDVSWLVGAVASLGQDLDFARYHEAIAHEFVRDPRVLAVVLSRIASRLPPGPDRVRLLRDAGRLAISHPHTGRPDPVAEFLLASVNGEPAPAELVEEACEAAAPDTARELRLLTLLREGKADACDQLLATSPGWSSQPAPVREETIATALAVWDGSGSPAAPVRVVEVVRSDGTVTPEAALRVLIDAAKADRTRWVRDVLSGTQAGHAVIVEFPLAAAALSSLVTDDASAVGRARRLFRRVRAIEAPLRWSIRLEDWVQRRIGFEEDSDEEPAWYSVAWVPPSTKPVEQEALRVALAARSASRPPSDRAALVDDRLHRVRRTRSRERRLEGLLDVTREAVDCAAPGVAREALTERLDAAYDPRTLREFRTAGMPMWMAWPLALAVPVGIGMALFLLFSTLVGFPLGLYTLLKGGELSGILDAGFQTGVTLWFIGLVIVGGVAVSRFRTRLRGGAEAGPTGPTETSWGAADWAVERKEWETAVEIATSAFRSGEPDLGERVLRRLVRERSKGPDQRVVPPGVVEDDWSAYPAQGDIVGLCGLYANHDLESAWDLAKAVSADEFFAHALEAAMTDDERWRLAFGGIRLLAGEPPEQALPALSSLLRAVDKQGLASRDDVHAGLQRLGIPSRVRRIAYFLLFVPAFPLGLLVLIPLWVGRIPLDILLRWAIRPAVVRRAARLVQGNLSGQG